MKTQNLIFTFLIFMGFTSNLFGQKKLPEEWNFYMTTIENKPASIYLNLGLHSLIPIKEKSNLTWISVKLNDQIENGLTTDEESKILFEIEDKILETINNNNSLYIGRMTNNGYRDFYFYSKDVVLFTSEAMKIANKYRNYELVIDSKKDKTWQGYLDIYPNEADFQSISNRDVLENLEKNGDNLSKARDVFHWIYFITENDRENYLKMVEKDNFVLVAKDFDKKNELPFGLQIKRIDKVDYGVIDDYTLYLWKLAKDNNGDYDGWETSVETE